MPNIGQSNPEKEQQEPLPGVASLEEQERIKKLYKTIDLADEVGKRELRPIAASVLQEYALNDEPGNKEVPNEVRLQALQNQLDLIGQGGEEENMAVAETIIDSIRGLDDSRLRLRGAGMISSNLQMEHVLPNDRSEWSREEVMDYAKQREIFELMTQEGDKHERADLLYKNWADMLLDPRGAVRVMAQLYNETGDEILPELKEEVVEAAEETGVGEAVIEKERELVGHEVVRLNPAFFVSLEKMQKFFELYDRYPPIYFTRQEGGDYIHVEFPQDLSSKAVGDILAYRDGKMTREEVHEKWEEEYWPEFLKRMEEGDKKEEFKAITNGGNIAIDFDFRVATLRNKYDSEKGQESTKGRGLDNTQEVAENASVSGDGAPGPDW